MSPRSAVAAGAELEPANDTVESASYALRRVNPMPLGPRWPLPLLASGSATLVATGAAPWLLGGGTAPMVEAGVLGTLTSSAVVLHSVRGQRRAEITDAARAALERVAGPVQDFRVRRWSGWFVGAPKWVRFRHQPGAVISDKLWPGDALAALAAVLGSGYRVHRHDQRRGVLKLRVKPAVVQATTDPTVDRAVSMMHQLFGQSAAVKASTADAGLQTVSITHECGVKATFPVWRERVERVVTTMLEGRWRARWDLQNDSVTFELRPEIEAFVQRPAPVEDPASPDFYKIPLGVDEDTEIVSWDLNSSMPHFLCSGKTGKGKTNVLRGVAMEVAARQIPVWLCDPKRVELIGLRDWPNVQIVATTVEEQIATILRAWDLMEERYAAIADGASEDDFELIVLVVDEFAEFSRRVAQWWTRVKVRGMPTVCPVMEKFDSLVRLGRTARFRIAIGLQRPDVRFFGESGESRDNFDSRLSLGRLSADGSRMMWGSSIGTSLPGVRGRAIACTSEDRACEIQTYWVPDPRRSQDDPAERAVLDRLRPGHAEYGRLTVVIPEPTVDSKGVRQEWDAVAAAVLEPYEGEPEADRPDRTADGDETDRDDVDEDNDVDENNDADEDNDLDERPEPLPPIDDNGTSANVVEFRRRDRTRSKPATTPVLVPAAKPQPVLVDQDPLAEYGPPATVAAGELEDGELVELDERWVVIESIEPDVFKDSDYVLAWRSIEIDSDEEGTVILPGASQLRSRSLDDVEDDSR